MLKEITLKNFKLFDETGVTITPGKITVFIGPNGTGKSSPLQALLLLKQAAKLRADRQFPFEGELIKLGRFKDLAHLQDNDRAIEIGLSASYQGLLLPRDTEPYMSPTGTYRYRLILRNGNFEQEGAILSDESHEPFLDTSAANPGMRPVKCVNRSQGSMLRFLSVESSNRRILGLPHCQ